MAEKKNDNEPSAKLIDMENVDITKLNGGRLFDQAFVSPNEEVQVIADTAGICITKAMNRPLAALQRRPPSLG